MINCNNFSHHSTLHDKTSSWCVEMKIKQFHQIKMTDTGCDLQKYTACVKSKRKNEVFLVESIEKILHNYFCTELIQVSIPVISWTLSQQELFLRSLFKSFFARMMLVLFSKMFLLFKRFDVSFLNGNCSPTCVFFHWLCST